MKLTICYFSFGLALLLAGAEYSDPVYLRFDMVGAAKKLCAVEIESTPGAGITIRVPQQLGAAATIRTFAHALNPPLFSYHSKELGQLALVSYSVGGGSGVSYSRYFVATSTGSGCQVIHEGLAEYCSVTPAVPRKSFALQSEFRGREEGFSQIVRLARPATRDADQHRQISHDVLGPVELQYRVKPGGEVPTIQCDFNRSSAHALVDMIETGFDTPVQWSLGILRERWPELGTTLQELVRSPSDERKEKIHELRERIDHILQKR